MNSVSEPIVSEPQAQPQVQQSTPPSDPVQQFRAFAEPIVVLAQSAVKDRRFEIKLTRVQVTARFEIASDYSVDVKKSDSLISPYVGEIKLKRRLVYDEFFGRKDFAEDWHPIVIECGYQDGQWKLRADLKERLMR